MGLLQPGTVDVLASTPYVGDSPARMLVLETGSPALVLGFFGAIWLWVVGFPASLVVPSHRIDQFAPAVASASATLLVGFGIWFLGDAVGLVS